MPTPITAGFKAFDYVPALSFSASLYLSDVLQTSFLLTVDFNLANDTRAHVDMSEYRGDDRYTSLVADMLPQLEAEGCSVSFDASTGLYTFTAPALQEIQLDFFLMPAKAQDLIGFPSANTTTAREASLTSTAPVPYWMECTQGLGDYKEDYEPGTQHDMYTTDGGHVFGVGAMGVAVHCDFSVIAETQVKTFSWKADLEDGASRDTYTLQDHIEHCRWLHPFLVYHVTGTALHRFRPEDAYFDHSRFFDVSNNAAWNVPFKTYVARL